MFHVKVAYLRETLHYLQSPLKTVVEYELQIRWYPLVSSKTITLVPDVPRWTLFPDIDDRRHRLKLDLNFTNEKLTTIVEEEALIPLPSTKDKLLAFS